MAETHRSHDWRLFVTPSEITELMREHGFAVQRADFVVFFTRVSLTISLVSGFLSLLSSLHCSLFTLHP